MMPRQYSRIVCPSLLSVARLRKALWLSFAIRLAVLVFVALSPPLRATAQNLLLKDYTSQDGLPDSRVAPIIQDREGYLWFGTQAGITRYDGSEFTNFGPAREIPGIFGRDIMEDHTGAIWFAFSGFEHGGVTRLWHGTSRTITHNTGLYGTQAFQVVEDQSGDLWVATDAGLERVHFIDSTRHSWTIIAPIDSAIMAVHVDHSGGLWYACSRGLIVIRNRTRTPVYSVRSGDQSWHVRPYSFYEARNGELWLGGFTGAYLVRDGMVRYFKQSDGLPERGVWCFSEDAVGTFWVGTMDGLYRRVGSDGHYRFVKVPSFGNAVVYDMCLDREGNLWFASAPGLRRLIAKDLEFEFPGKESLSTPGIGPIEQGHDGTMYFGSRTTGLYLLRDGRLLKENEFGSGSRLTITSIFPESDKRVWLGLWRGGAIVLQPASNEVFNSMNGLPSSNVHAITRTDGGTIIVGTSAGLAWMERGQTMRPLTASGLDTLSVFDVEVASHTQGRSEDPDTLWVATNDGVRKVVVDRSGVISLTSMPDTIILRGRIVYEILIDTEGRLWFATDGAGVMRLDDKGLTRYNREDGLVGDRVFALAEDSVANIWIGTSSGLSCFDGTSFRNFTFEQGFGEIGVHGLMTAHDGYLWVSSLPGVKKLKPVRFPKSTQPAPLYLTDVQVEDSHLGTVGEHELQPDPAVITFRYAALSFSDEANVRYRYRLDGFDRDWSQPVTSRQLRYTHLPPGKYTFTVIARSGDGVWSNVPVVFSFAILPPLWLRWWFFSAMLILVIGSTYMLYRYRLNKLVELERTRSRIAMDLHDDIGSSLTRISVMTEVAQRRAVEDRGSSADYFVKIGDTARDLIESLGDIVWAVDPAHDSLQNVVRRIVQFGQELCEARGITFETELSGSFENSRLSPERKRDLYLVFKEGFHNIVKHSGATRARFCVRPTDQGALLELLDDGSGIPDNLDGTGHGLTSMRERGGRAGLRFSLTSTMGEGTRILLEVKTA